jgi:hypothetical protein
VNESASRKGIERGRICPETSSGKHSSAAETLHHKEAIGDRVSAVDRKHLFRLKRQILLTSNVLPVKSNISAGDQCVNDF